MSPERTLSLRAPDVTPDSAPHIDATPNPRSARASSGRRLGSVTNPRALITPAGRAVKRLTKAVVRRALTAELEQLHRMHSDIGDMRGQVTRLAEVPAGVERLASQEINLELLKAEVRSLERGMEELGMQLAPGTGLKGVGARIGELREQTRAVSRRLAKVDADVTRLASAHVTTTPLQPNAQTGTDPSPDDAIGATSVDATPPAAGTLDELFDYVAFEQRFRGDSSAVLATQTERYADLLGHHSPVLDWGCGRGELLEVLAARGTQVHGVELDPGMVSEARARGLDVHLGDAVSFLDSCPADSFGAIFSAHVAEHISFVDLLRVIHASLRALRPGGIFVAETPNPATLLVTGNSFILDPTHLRPIHPSLFAFACEIAGFRDVRLLFHAPATSYHLQHVSPDVAGAATINANVDRLNDVLFGAQEYTIIATKGRSAPTDGSL